MKIKVEYVYPPIPIRTSDYCAYDGDTGPDLGMLIGYGETPEKAIEAFKEIWETHYGEDFPE